MTKKILIFLLIMLGSIDLVSQNNKPLTQEQVKKMFPSEQRFVYDLGGKWQKSLDDDNWEMVNLPYSTERETKVIYKRTIKIDASMLNKFAWQLHFQGIDHQVEVYFNEQFVGRYFGGMVPFNVRIPDRMITGETNNIKLIISPAESAARQIRNQHLFAKQIYTGVIREIFLIGTPQVWVSDVKFKSDFNESLTNCSINATVNISSASINTLLKNSANDSNKTNANHGKVNLRIESFLRKKGTNDIIAQSNPKDFSIEGERTITENIGLFSSNFELWSPQTPNLYELEIKLSRNGITFDNFKVNYAFRKISVGKNGDNYAIFLNNQPFEMKGLNYYEDIYDYNQTMPLEKMEYDVNLIKTIGANVVRFKYFPPNESFINLCDERGLLLMVELPVYDVPTSIINTDEIKVLMQNSTKQLITMYDCHPSIFAWGISDGVIEGTAEFKEYSSQIINLFKATSSKLIYKIVPFESNEIDLTGIDFVGLRNLKQKINLAEYANEIKRVKSLVSSKPLFITFGTVIHPKNHNGYSDPLSLEYQAYIISNIYKLAKENNLAGNVINSFNDYLLNSPILVSNNENIYLCTSGITDRTRQQRLSFSTLQALFNNEKEPLLNAGSYAEKTPVSFIITGLIVGILIIFLINRFRRFREYMFRSLLRPYNFYADIRDQRIMSSALTIILGLAISLTIGLYLTSILYYYRTSDSAQYLLNLVFPSVFLQELFFRFIWIPEISLVLMAFIAFLITFIFAFLISIFAFFMRARIFFNDSITLSVWAGIPLLILLPISIILIRILVVSPSTVWIFLSIFLILGIWTISRILRSSAVVFDVLPRNVYIVGGLIITVFTAVVVGMYQIKFSILAYLKYFFDIFMK